MIQGETILMTPEQTVQLINLLQTKRTESRFSVNEVARRADVDARNRLANRAGHDRQPRRPKA